MRLMGVAGVVVLVGSCAPPAPTAAPILSEIVADLSPDGAWTTDTERDEWFGKVEVSAGQLDDGRVLIDVRSTNDAGYTIHIEVWLTLRPEHAPLVEAHAKTVGHGETYPFNPVEGAVKVSSDGMELVSTSSAKNVTMILEYDLVGAPQSVSPGKFQRKIALKPENLQVQR